MSLSRSSSPATLTPRQSSSPVQYGPLRCLRVRAKTTSGLGGSTAGPAARREGGSVSAAILDRPSNEADGPAPPRPGGLGGSTLARTLSRFGWFLLSLAVAAQATAQTITARWVGGSGNWSDPAHWDIGRVPNNAGGSSFHVIIDVAGQTPIVTVNQAVTLSGLTLAETLQVASGARLTISGPVANSGTLTVAGGSLSLQNVTLANAGRTLSAEAGLIELIATTVNGGTLRLSDHANSLIRFSGDVTLNNVAWDDPGAGEFQVYNTTARLLGDRRIPPAQSLIVWAHEDWQNDAQLTFPAGLFTNEGTIELRTRGNSFPRQARLHLEADSTLAGTGELRLSRQYDYGTASAITGPTNATLTLGPAQRLHGAGDIQVQLLNQGTLEADQPGQWLSLAQGLTNTGTIGAQNGGVLSLNATAAIDDPGRIAGQSSGTVAVPRDLLGTTRNADQYLPLSVIQFNGSGTAAAPQRFEAMSRDLGAAPDGFKRNFAYSTLALANNTYVQLVDDSRNSTSPNAEAVYVNSINVPAGCTLDLNHLHLYARLMQLSGTIVNGTVGQVPDSGPLVLATATPGRISAAGELDEWTFFGRAGRSVTVVVNPGGTGSPAAPPPLLYWAQVTLLDVSAHTLAAATNSTSGQVLTLNDVPLPADGLYRVQVRAAPQHSASTGNYLVTVWDVTADVAALPLNQQRNGAIETPYAVDRWTFAAVAGQQLRFNLIMASSPGVAFDLRRDQAPPGEFLFKDLPGSSDLVTVTTSGTYTLTAHGRGGQSGAAYAFRVDETTQTPLALGATLNGTLAAGGQAQLFRVTVPNSGPLKVVLNGLPPKSRIELYAQIGVPPTRALFDYHTASSTADKLELLIPMAPSGTWFFLVYADYLPSPGTYTLATAASPIVLSGVAPNRQVSNLDAVLTLRGAGFDSTTTVRLIASNGTAFPSTVTVDSFEQMTATLAAASVPPGRYAVRASKPGAWDELPDAFEMVGAGHPHLETRLIVPESVGRHAPATLYVEYANTGDATMPAPLLVVTGTQRPLLTLASHLMPVGFWTSARPQGFSETVQLLACGRTPGVLQPGESFRVPIYFAGLQQPWSWAPTVEFQLGALTADNPEPVDWASLRTSLRPDRIDAAAWEVLWTNFTTQVGTTWGDYVRMLDDNAAYLGRLGQQVVDLGPLLAFEFLQADGLNPIRTLASAVDAAAEAPGLPLVFSRSFPNTVSQRFELGPLGRSWSHNWQYALTASDDGTVKIHGPGGALRVYLPDSRNRSHYFSQPGDHATLTPIGGGAFTLREPAGLLRAFRADGFLDYVEDPNGNRITCTYAEGRLIRLTHSAGTYLVLDYNPAGRIAEVRDALDRRTTFTYNADTEHLESARYFDGRSVTYTYAASPAAHRHAILQIDDGSTRRTFTYDRQGRLSSTSRATDAEKVTFTYDHAGTVSVTDALNATSRFSFDHRGLLAKTEDPLGHAVHLAFDDDFNLVRLTDPAGHAYAYAYDDAGNLIQSIDPLGHASRFTYEPAFSRLASVTDANGNPTRYSYDAAGNLQAITYADDSRETWAYDAQGSPSAWTNRRGRSIQFTSNTAGQLTRKQFADGSRSEYAYDPRGNLTNAATLNPQHATLSSATFRYNAADRLTNIAFNGVRSLTFTYDAAGRRSSSLDQRGHRLTYHYDTAGRLESMTNELGQLVVRYAYDPTGRLTQRTLGNGLTATYRYDPAGQLLTLTNRLANGQPVSWFNYTYDPRGRRTAMKSHYGTWDYDYDDLGQLTRAVLQSIDPQIPNQDLTYVYDPLGNRIRTVENGVTANYTTNPLNQYTRRTEVGGQTIDYVFDLDGNLIAERSPTSSTRYVYNDENRLVAVERGADSWEYAYDALGNRVASTDNGVATTYVIDPIGLGNVVGEYDAQGNLIARYDHGMGLLSRTDSAGAAAYYTFDAIGNTHELVTSAGAIANAYAYAPFGGRLKATTLVTNPYGFVGSAGVRLSEDAQLFMRSRAYHPSLGRFAVTDPLGIPTGGMNLYSYVRNRPLTSADPLGLWEASDTVDAVEVGRSAVEHGLVYYLQHAPLSKLIGPGPSTPFATDLQTLRYFGNITTLLSALYAMPEAIREWKQYYLVSVPAWLGGTVPTAELVRSGAMAWGKTAFGLVPFAQHALDWYNRVSGETLRLILDEGGLWYAFKFYGHLLSQLAHALDPNEKTGPSGVGSLGYLSPDAVLAYRIDFENDTNATAPAQIVQVTDQLSPNLDWSSFQLTEIGFGNRLLTIPPGRQYFETTVPITYHGATFEVWVIAGIDLAQGRVYAEFYSIDPATELPPPVSLGFLPPEDGTGRGMGHVSFTIVPQPALTTGTQLRNIADIVFDRGEVIATNQKDPHNPSQGTDPAKECLNTIDADPPASAVMPLPTESDARFQLAWSGTDIGAGIAAYTLYVSTNHGPWSVWLANTTNTTAEFQGSLGATYGFVSVARDAVGNTEPFPATADTATTVLRDNTMPRLQLEWRADGTLGISWQIPADAPAESIALESSAVLGEGAAWVLEPPDQVTADKVGWLWVSPDAEARFYRLKRNR